METLKRSHHLIPHLLASSRRNRLSRNWVGSLKNPLASRLLACQISYDTSFTQFDSTTRSDIMQIAFTLCGVEFKSLYTVPGAVYLIFLSSERSEIKAWPLPIVPQAWIQGRSGALPQPEYPSFRGATRSAVKVSSTTAELKYPFRLTDARVRMLLSTCDGLIQHPK